MTHAFTASPGLCVHTHASTPFRVWPHHCSHRWALCWPTQGPLPYFPPPTPRVQLNPTRPSWLPTLFSEPNFHQPLWHLTYRVIISWEGGKRAWSCSSNDSVSCVEVVDETQNVCCLSWKVTLVYTFEATGFVVVCYSSSWTVRKLLFLIALLTAHFTTGYIIRVSCMSGNVWGSKVSWLSDMVINLS